MQGSGDKDLWQLVLERVLGLVAEGGTVSMIIPSQILTNSGGIDMRKRLLRCEILSLYVFENRKKIFPIDSRYRFALLTVRNDEGPDRFPAGFYLHSIGSLDGNGGEAEKFHEMSKSSVLSMSPDDYVIPEVDSAKIRILGKISGNKTLEDGIGDGWEIKLSRGFDTAIDADLFREDGKGWPVLKGRNIHQYNHEFAPPEFTADRAAGLERECRKKIYKGRHLDVYNSFRLAFRRVTSPTNMRTMIAAIIPPHVFHADTMRFIVLFHYGRIILDINYYKKILYMCGVFNSLTFDFIARTKTQLDLPSIIKSLLFPKDAHEDKIACLAAKLVVGGTKFLPLAESMGIPNKPLTMYERLKTAAEIDVLVALSYGIGIQDYREITKSFRSFKRNPELRMQDGIKWDNSNLREFYGEMADLALKYFEEMSK